MKLFHRIIDAFDIRSSSKWIVLASLVGVVAGLGAIAFHGLGQLVTHFSLTQFAGFTPTEAVGEHELFESSAGVFSPWILVAIMVVGGLLSGCITYTFAPEADGTQTSRRRVMRAAFT